MTFLRRSGRPLLGLVTADALMQFAPASVAAADWPLVTPAERALSKPRIDPTADAEVLLWDVRITDSDALDEVSTIFEHHLRIKIFTERGRDEQSRVDLTYMAPARVRDVEARTIAPDGTITTIRDQDVFDRNIVQADGFKLRAKSFVMPAVTPGAIIEYRWREIHDNSLADDLELEFQRDIPVHVVRYHVKPLAVRSLGFQMRTQAFNMASAPEMKKEDLGYTLFERTSVPGLRREPLMPPRLTVVPWMLLYYADLGNVDRPTERFWSDFAKETFNALKPQLRLTPEVRGGAEAAVKGVPPDRAIDAIVAYARSHVKVDAGAGRRKENKHAGDTLKRGAGTSTDLTIATAAMLMAAGLETRLALLPDRRDFFSHPNQKQPYFIRHLAAAVHTGATWRFVDSAHEFGPGGRLRWQHEGQYALLLDDKTPGFVVVPVGTTADSRRHRTAALRLDENGTLSGDVRLEYTGHAAAVLRASDIDTAPEERERTVRDSYVKRLPGAEITKFTTLNLEKPDEPYVVSFTLTVPGYAQRAGSRLLLQPSIFEKGGEALFTASARQHPVHLPYPWSEEDTVAIDVPAGYRLEGAPGFDTATLGAGAGLYAPKLAVTPDGSRLVLTRTFNAGGNQRILFEPSDYASVKAFFDIVQKGDNAAIALRRSGEGQ